jgi:Zn2+/Cd2+-exporting ATPase
MNDRTAEPHAHDHGHHDHHHGHRHGPTCAHTSDGSEDGDSAVDLGAGQHRFRVSGMDCASCANTISTAIGGLPGVSDIKVSVAREMMTLALDETRTSAATIEEKVRGLGYGVERADAPDTPVPRRAAIPWWKTAKGLHAIIGGLATLVAFGLSAVSPAYGEGLFAVVAVLLALPIARRAVAAAAMGAPFTIEMLMTVAVIGAVVIGESAEAAVVVFLFATGEVLEGYAAGRARAGIEALGSLVPDRAIIEEGGTRREIRASEVTPGMIVVVRPGDRVAADGEIAEGLSHLDEAAITGESMPVSRGPGDPVFAGSVNIDAMLKVRANRAAADNTIARIVRLVEEAQDAKAPTERFIDRFSRIYTPLIALAALLVALLPPLLFGAEWQTWVYRALALLLIGCPCALVISVPASIASALSSAARAGILLKGGAVMEALARTEVVAFDKTGTLTVGRPVVTDLFAVDGNETALLSMAAAIEQGSSHPLAEAIVEAARGRGVTGADASDIRAIAGKGVAGRVDGKAVFIGAPRFAAEEGSIPEDLSGQIAGLEADGKTVAVLVVEGKAVGAIALRDQPRDDASSGVASLHRLGIETQMLSGDNPATAAAIGATIGIDRVRGGMLPEQKVEALRSDARRRPTVMVGDGINDAAALAAAHVGMAMGSGTGLALETADAALMGNRVSDVARTIVLARAAMANIQQNVAIALGLKAVFLVTTLLGITGLWIAVLADTGATVLVTLNAMRLLAPPRMDRDF